MADALFELDDGPAPVVSSDGRRVLRQAAALAGGAHPLGLVGRPLALHVEAAPAGDRAAPGRRCGTCRWRQRLAAHTRSYPKCLNPGGLGADEYEQHGPPRVSHGASTDVRAWWPGCTDHTYGDPALGTDAARWIPTADD